MAVDTQERLKLEMSTAEAVHALSEGNPGAMSVIVALLKSDRFPDVMMLDSLNIYGSDIWVLYKDCCGGDLGKLSNLFYGWRTGTISKEAIKTAISSGGMIRLEI